ncbi:MAG: hypothetical protein NC048_05280 [Bacteroides sp.]|nr:hypothetical protein [Ruminococcus flavefaciens]MCM1554889.1 hypothetical protein [Bacteroides sp.]
MRKICLILLLLFCIFGQYDYARGEYGYPPEWKEYTLGGYLYDIQSDSNSRNQSEVFFKDQLLDVARANIAKQIELKIQDYARMKTSVVDGRSREDYGSETKFNTKANLRFVETQTFYDASKKEGAVVAYISKERIRNFYSNELLLLNNKIESAITNAENYISEGLKSQVVTELKTAQLYFSDMEEPLGWMNIFGSSSSELNQWQSKLNNNERKIKQLLAEQQYGTRIYLECKADLFDTPYPLLEKELKGLLSKIGCSFTQEASSADWAITVYCSARESNHIIMGNMHAYFAYVDAVITLDWGIRSQRVMEDAVSEKGGDTRSYHAAAEAAYRQIKEILVERLKQTIQ